MLYRLLLFVVTNLERIYERIYQRGFKAGYNRGYNAGKAGKAGDR